MQAAFVRQLLMGSGNPTAAARAAGYAEPAVSAHLNLQVPAVLEAIGLEIRRRLHGELAPLAIGFMRAVLEDESGKYGERVKADITKMALDRAGFVPPRLAPSSAGEAKTPDQMTTAELHAMAAELDNQIQSRAVLVEQVSEPIDAELADLI
jgi:phage terminase small subunit